MISRRNGIRTGLVVLAAGCQTVEALLVTPQFLDIDRAGLDAKNEVPVQVRLWLG